MPTYEYVCKNCGHVFEIVQSMKDAALVECPVCGGELRKVFTPPAISFKGSGFYATDHGKKGKPAESSPKPEKTEKTDQKTDQKTDKTEKSSGASGDPSGAKSDAAASSKPAPKEAS